MKNRLHLHWPLDAATSIALLLLGAAPSDVHSADTGYEVGGSFTEEPRFGEPAVSRSFICSVLGPEWYIHTSVVGENRVVKVPVGPQIGYFKRADAQTAYSDGTNFYATTETDFGGAAAPAGTNAVPGPGMGGKMGPGSVPFGVDNSLLVVWYSFASAEYLAGRSSGKILPLHSVVFEDAQSGDHMVSAQWRLFRDPPHLPEWLQSSNYFNLTSPRLPVEVTSSPFPNTNVVFRVLSWTNQLDLYIPSRVTVDYYFHRMVNGQVREIPGRSFDLVVDRVSAVDKTELRRPTLRGPAVVLDFSRWFSNPPSTVTLVTSNGWPTDEALARAYSARAGMRPGGLDRDVAGAAGVPTADLVGKPLPDLARLGLTPADYPGGQPLLVALTDAEQRPSRRALALLAEQSAALKQKGISVVVVQAAAIDDVAFAAWKKEAALPFPVGRFAEDAEKARAAWGADALPALPRLILTDKDHRVVAQGLQLEDVTAKVDALLKMDGEAAAKAGIKPSSP